MKAVQLLINSYLPEDLRDYSRVYDAKDLNNILSRVAKEYPDRFSEILKKVSDLGRKASWLQGETITLQDFVPVIDKASIYEQMDAEIAALPKDANFRERRQGIYQKYNQLIEKETAKNALANRNNIAMAVLSGARGKNPQLKAMISTPGTYSDYKDRPIDVFSRESFAEGIRPATFLASTYGTRASTVSTKVSTAKGGDWAKQMASTAADMVVRKENCGTHNGMAYSIDDPSLKGRALAKDTAGIPAGTFITRDIIKKLEKEGAKKVVARSPITCSVPNGLCAHCVGKFYDGGKLPKIGAHIGALASSTSAEPVCLVKGTLVRMADGSAKAIEDIKPGDMVLGSDEHAHCSPVKVVNVFHNGMRDCYRSYVKLGIANEVSMCSTLAHKTLSCICREGDTPEFTIRPIGELPTKCKLLVKLAGGQIGQVVSQKHLGMRDTYDIEVDNGSHLFALANGLIVSNTQMALCLHEDTEVRMADFSTRKIKDIIPGELVLGADKAANTFPVRVLGVFNQGEKTVRDYTFGKGQTKYRAIITATEDHKILLNKRVSSAWNIEKYGNSWGAEPYKLTVTPLGQMNKNTHAAYAKDYSGEHTEHVDGVLAYMAGIFLGDGIRFTGSNEARISCADLQLVEEVNKEASVLGMKLIKRKRGHDWGFTRNTPGGSSPYRELLRELNFDDKYCHQKRIPEVVFNWDDESVRRFIAGYFDSDGSIYRTRAGNYGIGFLSTSKELIADLKMLLELRFGIHSTPVYSDKKLQKGANFIKHSIAINRGDLVRKFADTVAEYSRGVKREKLRALDFSDMQDRNPSGITFGKAQGQSDVYKANCYDIEVDHPDHLFVLANGLIVSNSAKHTAGMTQGKRSYSGLEYIQQFTQSPEAFKDRAAVSEKDGTVEAVEEAPQGGLYITVAGEKHYVPHGHESIVKEGDTVEAGDQLSEGLVDPEDIIRLKGIGEGRRYYAERLNQILADSGAATDKRNTEVLARAAIRHIRVTDPEGMGVYLPDDVADYNAVQTSYKVPETARIMRAKDAVGKYLQQPVMHFSIGTRVTPKVAKELVENDYNDVWADDKAPTFEPEMIRLRTSSHTTRDWLASMGTSYLAKQLNESATRGDDTNVRENDDYRPRLAIGVGFGQNIEETGKF